MLDKFFCKRLHAKKITLGMVMDYIIDSPIYGECLCILSVFAAALTIIHVATHGFIAVLLPVCIGVSAGAITLLFRYFIAPKIQVASCPLKNGG